MEIQIWDSGPAIPADQQAMVFEEFVQLQNPARNRTQGLGLGLAIVRRTAILLQHPLKLVSVTGRGSMFSVTVPLITIFFLAAVGLLAAVTGIDLTGRARRNIKHVDVARHAKRPKRRQIAGR